MTEAATEAATKKAELKAEPTDLAGPGDVVTVALADLHNPTRLHRIEQAWELPELERDVEGTDSPAEPVSEFHSAIQSFKGPDRRTMRVVVLDGILYQQEI